MIERRGSHRPPLRRLIGITTALGVSDDPIEGIGFAMAIEIVTRVVDELIMTGGRYRSRTAASQAPRASLISMAAVDAPTRC